MRRQRLCRLRAGRRRRRSRGSAVLRYLLAAQEIGARQRLRHSRARGEIKATPLIPAAQMGSSRTPAPGRWLADRPSPDGFLLDIAKCGPQVLPVERAGAEAVRPEVATETTAGIEVLCMASMHALQAEGEGVGLRGAYYEVYVIADQAVSEIAEVGQS